MRPKGPCCEGRSGNGAPGRISGEKCAQQPRSRGLKSFSPSGTRRLPNSGHIVRLPRKSAALPGYEAMYICDLAAGLALQLRGAFQGGLQAEVPGTGRAG